MSSPRKGSVCLYSVRTPPPSTPGTQRALGGGLLSGQCRRPTAETSAMRVLGTHHASLTLRLWLRGERRPRRASINTLNEADRCALKGGEQCPRLWQEACESSEACGDPGGPLPFSSAVTPV